MQEVLEYFGFDGYIKPKETGLSKNACIEYGEEVRELLDEEYGRSSLKDHVSNLGGLITFSTTLNHDMPRMIVNCKGKFVINLERHTSLGRDKFTVSQCLGFYFLHYPEIEPRKMIVEQHIHDRSDWEAIWFAMGFLVSIKELETEMAYSHDFLKDNPESIVPLMAGRFNVTHDMIVQRFKCDDAEKIREIYLNNS